MKKILAIILVLCTLCSLLSACQNNYTFFETRDLAEYAPNSKIFPSSIENGEVLSFGDAAYNYESYSVDEFLVLRFNSSDVFQSELARINELKSKYECLEKENYFVDGYRFIFFPICWSSKIPENINDYIYSSVGEYSYSIMWELVMISESEMTIVYNYLYYDTLNFAKWEDRNAYIASYFNLDLKEIAENVTN